MMHNIIHNIMHNDACLNVYLNDTYDLYFIFTFWYISFSLERVCFPHPYYTVRSNIYTVLQILGYRLKHVCVFRTSMKDFSENVPSLLSVLNGTRFYQFSSFFVVVNNCTQTFTYIMIYIFIVYLPFAMENIDSQIQSVEFI